MVNLWLNLSLVHQQSRTEYLKSGNLPGPGLSNGRIAAVCLPTKHLFRFHLSKLAWPWYPFKTDSENSKGLWPSTAALTPLSTWSCCRREKGRGEKGALVVGQLQGAENPPEAVVR